MSCSLIKQGCSSAERFEYISDIWARLSGGVRLGFDNPTYLSEKATADRNFCLGYMMRESNAFPEGADLVKDLELYFQTCSMLSNSDNFAVVAATLANGGICPTNGDQIFNTTTVRNCLSLMYSCGMYDFSGEWAFRIGIPAKSGVGGAIIGVIPQVGGFCTWSPPLDHIGNSFRGVEFYKKLGKVFNFHHYDGLHSAMETSASRKIDPTRIAGASEQKKLVSFLFAAAEGDLEEIRRLVALSIDINGGDYDRRTALHLASSEGRVKVVKYLLDLGANAAPMDRWGRTPLDDATEAGHSSVVKALKKVLNKQ